MKNVLDLELNIYKCSKFTSAKQLLHLKIYVEHLVT